MEVHVGIIHHLWIKSDILNNVTRFPAFLSMINELFLCRVNIWFYQFVRFKGCFWNLITYLLWFFFFFAASVNIMVLIESCLINVYNSSIHFRIDNVFLEWLYCKNSTVFLTFSIVLSLLLASSLHIVHSWILTSSKSFNRLF